MKVLDHIGTIAITLAILFVFALWIASSEKKTSETTEPLPSTSIERFRPQLRTMWAHGTVNIRAGRGTEHPVVARLRRGESIQVDSLVNGWYRAWKNGRPIGYVAASVLHDRPLPDVEIVSWNWHIERLPGWTTVTWVAQLRNNTRRHIEIVQLEFTTFDRNGNILDTDVGFAQSIPPGGTASAKGLATYHGGEYKASLRVVEYY